MTSLVTEVLLQAGKLDKDDLQTKISKLSSRSNELKAKIDHFIQKKYGEFNPMFVSCEALRTDITEQQVQAKDIQGSLSGVIKTQLQDSTSEFESLSEEHSRTSELLFSMDKVCQISDLFDNYANSRKNKNIKDSASAILEIQSVMESIKSTYMNDINVFKFLKRQFVLVSEGVRYELDEKWINEVTWILPPKDGSPSEVILKIPFLEKSDDANSSDQNNFQDFVYAMSMLGRLNVKVQRFADMVMKHIMHPLIDDQSLTPDFDNEENMSRRFQKICLTKKGSTDKDGRKVKSPGSPAKLFQNVVKVLHCFHRNLLCFKTSEDPENNKSMMSLFSEHIRDDLLQLLIDKCLALTIPKSREDLENYKEVEDLVRKFESALAVVNFIPAPSDGEPGSKLMAYSMNVSFHFANQRCTDILQNARALMKKEIHNTQLVSDKDMGDFKQVLKESTKISSEMVKMPVGTGFDSQKPSKLLSDDTLHFPKCRVSICAIDLMKLAYKTMNEASLSDPASAVRLVTTTQNIFELYYTAYPIYHKESLENLPQFSAIFHNDCMYLAHHLLTFGHQFSKVSPEASKFMRVLTFVDKVPLLRRLGAECFLKQMRKQKDLMIQCLEPLRTFTALQNEGKYNIAEKAIKQILYQLNHLKKIWLEVLQEHILHRALCTLVNSCVAEVVAIICAMEDISADDSVSLKLVCLLLSDYIPLLFKKQPTEEADVGSKIQDLSWQKDMSKWFRLQELILMLSWSLREIVDRWSEGKGPLASAFSITEVKGLIRALFQNTEHRAEAISKIRL